MTQPPAVRELDIELERNSPVPLYYQLAQSIEHAINTGELAPGDRLENEIALTSRLGLSRPTARQAIQELVQKGLLVRKRGVGTQVVRSQFRRDERLSSLNEDLAKAGRTPSTQVLEYRIGENRWVELPPAPIPTRSFAALVFTGSELLFWGGVGAEGPEMSGATWHCC